jgi:hypothetical protein
LLKDMKAHTHLKPGQKGARRLMEQFGDKLLCIRYRYDEIRQVRMKTAEIIVDERPCDPNMRHRDKDIVAVMVPFTKLALRDRLKAAGGRWNPEEKIWRVPFGAIRGDTELVERIMKE